MKQRHLFEELKHGIDEARKHDQSDLTNEEWWRAWQEEIRVRAQEVSSGRAQLYSAKETIEELRNKYKND